MTAGADENWRFSGIVDHPAIASPTDRRHRRVLEHAHVCPPQQEVIELAASDGIADDARVACFDQLAVRPFARAIEDTSAKGGDLCSVRPAERYAFGSSSSAEKHRASAIRRTPCRAGTGAVCHDDVPAGQAQDARARRS